jgi:hypothetical protein
MTYRIKYLSSTFRTLQFTLDVITSTSDDYELNEMLSISDESIFNYLMKAYDDVPNIKSMCVEIAIRRVNRHNSKALVALSIRSRSISPPKMYIIFPLY